MANFTVAQFIDDFMVSADQAAARTVLGLGTAATTADTDYATAAQGDTADTAIQPGDAAALASIRLGGGGATISKVLIATGNPSGSIGAASYLNFDIGVAGAAAGDFAVVSTGTNATCGNGIVLAEVICDTDHVFLRYYNTDLISSQSLGGSGVTVMVFKAS